MHLRQEGDWDFGPVFDLSSLLSDCDDVPLNINLLSSTSSNNAVKPVSVLDESCQKSILGDFDKIWKFLDQPSDVPPPVVPPPPEGEADQEVDESTSLELAISKGVKWRDEAEGGELADNEDLGDDLSSLGLSKQQRKKLRRSQRKAARSAEARKIQPTSSSDYESEGPPTPKQSPDRRAVIQSILHGSVSKPDNETLDFGGFKTRPKVPVDPTGWPVANPHIFNSVHSARFTGQEIALNVQIRRKESLVKKLRERFVAERAFLRNIGLTNTPSAMNGVIAEGIHVFVDASNIMIGFHDCLKISRGLPLEARIHRQPFSFHNLSLVLERGRPVAKKVLVGSDNFAAIQEAKAIGYETNILDRVHKAKELTPRQKRYTPRHHLNGSTPLKAALSGGSGSETNAAFDGFGKEKWVEQAVDEILHLKILESVVDAREPSTMVLATGDAAEAEYSQGFLRMVERALEKGWKVEVMSFRKNTSGMYKRKEFRKRWGEKFQHFELDDFVEELRGAE